MTKNAYHQLLALMALASTGCSMFGPMFGSKPVATDPTVLPRPMVQEFAREDRARLAGEDNPGSNSRFVAGADIGYDDWYYVPVHVTVHAVGSLYDRFFGDNKPSKYAVGMEDTKSSDHRRESILTMASYPFARHDPYVKRYSQIAQEAGADGSVRSAAIRAMNRSRDNRDIEIYIRYLDHSDPAVRLEAVKALGNIPSEGAVVPLLKRLESDESKDVRIAAADALREYKTLDVSRALINVLGDKDFAVAWQAHESLLFQTGRDFKYDDLAWLGYFSKSEKPFN